MSWITTVLLKDPVSQEVTCTKLSTPGRPAVQIANGMVTWFAADGESRWWPVEYVGEIALQQRS